MSFLKVTKCHQVCLNSEGTFGHFKSQYASPDAGPIFQNLHFCSVRIQNVGSLIYQENSLEVRAFTIFLEYIYLVQNK